MTATVTLSGDDLRAAVREYLHARGFKLAGEAQFHHSEGRGLDPSATSATVVVDVPKVGPEATR